LKKPDQVVWEGIARAIRADTEPIAAIAKRTGIAAITIRARAHREGWTQKPATSAKSDVATPARPPRRTKSKGSTSSRKLSSKPRARAKTPADLRLRLIKNFYNTIAKKLRQITDRIAAGGKLTIADDERQARTLITMIRCVEGTLGLETDLARNLSALATGDSVQPAAELAADAERWRTELAKRIQRVERLGP
jgi:hypothetical protein